MKRRTDLETEILVVIQEYSRTHGFPPTYREVSSIVQSVHSNVWLAVKHLQEGGFLRETPSSIARSLVLSPAGIERVLDDSTATPVKRTQK